MEHTSIMAPYYFSDDELLSKSRELGHKIQEKSQIEEELKGVKSDFKAKIDKLGAEIGEVSNNLASGYVLRSTRCRIVRDFGLKLKHFYRLDDGTRIRTERFDDRDFQLPIDFATDGRGQEGPILPEMPENRKDVGAMLTYFEDLLDPYVLGDFAEEDLPGELERVSCARYAFTGWRKNLEASMTSEEFDRLNALASGFEQVEELLRRRCTSLVPHGDAEEKAFEAPQAEASEAPEEKTAGEESPEEESPPAKKKRGRPRKNEGE